MHALVMQPCTRVARARCARGTRCWLARGDSSPRPSPRALHIRARAAGFHCSCHSLCRLPLSLYRSSHSAGFLCLSLCVFVRRASSLGFRVGLHFFSRLSLSSFKLRLHIKYYRGIWTTSNFSKSDSSVVLALVYPPFMHSRPNR